MTKVFKKIFYKLFSDDCEKIDLDNFDVIFFDVYDTLIKRDVKNVTDVYDLVQKEYNCLFSEQIYDFKEKRINAERRARNNSKNEELTLDEIYHYLDYKNNQKLMELECKVELNITCINYPIYLFYKKCVQQKKKIFFVSDMYLPINLLKQILEKNGYSVNHGIYLSSDKMMTKRSGKLFELVAKENNLSYETILHLGDTFMTDFLPPKKIGMNSILVDRYTCNTLFELYNSVDLNYNVLSSFINNHICQYKMDVYEKFGYEVFGPILLSFVRWVHTQVIENKIQKIFFLARDAKIIMDVYKKQYQEELPIFYLKVSRKSVLMANIVNIRTLDELLEKFQMMLKNTSNVKDLFSSVNLKYESYKKELEKYSIFDNVLIMNLSKTQQNNLFNIIKDDLYENCKLQNNYLKKYLQQVNFTGNIALIDIGWNGTIQYYLQKFCDTSTKIFGYYYGVNNDNRYKNYDTLNRSGYLFSSQLDLDNQRTIQVSLGLFEMLFLATEGSTLGYKEVNHKIVPVCAEVDYSEKNILTIQKLQSAAKLFVDDAFTSEFLFLEDCNIAFQNYKNFIQKPTLKNVKLFKNIEFLNAGKYKLIHNKSLFYYVLHPKIFYVDLKNSDCKIMFMKSVFKLKFPYYKFLKAIYEKK